MSRKHLEVVVQVTSTCDCNSLNTNICSNKVPFKMVTSAIVFKGNCSGKTSGKKLFIHFLFCPEGISFPLCFLVYTESKISSVLYLGADGL